MAVLKLYGISVATSTQRVATVLHELKIPFELIEVPYEDGELKTQEYLRFQPFGQVPYIDDDGFILYETRAICRYIAAKFPESGLIPTGSRENALFEQAASVELTNFDPSASQAGVQLYWKRIGLPYNETIVPGQLEILDKILDSYEVILSKQPYVGGNTLSLADLFHLPYAAYVTLGGSDIMTATHRPNVARWHNELTSRPSWLAYEGGVKTTMKFL
ncbi:glutathione S-transferase [Favolaschia claudopus]|uniref:glutathione transferase n=1 Tax=Favolaschia claudopus TaxID=2862362 RepID=A0AAW0E207_9AGAR